MLNNHPMRMYMYSNFINMPMYSSDVVYNRTIRSLYTYSASILYPFGWHNAYNYTCILYMYIYMYYHLLYMYTPPVYLPLRISNTHTHLHTTCTCTSYLSPPLSPHPPSLPLPLSLSLSPSLSLPPFSMQWM